MVVLTTSGDFVKLLGSENNISDQIDISLIDPTTGNVIDVKGMSEGTIEFNLNIEKSTNSTGKITKCVYWDTVAEQYSSEGLITIENVDSTTKEVTSVTCKSTHLTSFSA